MLYGNANPSLHGILPTSIVGLLSGQNANAGCDPRSAVAKNCSLTNAGFSPAQVSFLSNISHIPVLAFLLKTQHDPAMMQDIAEDLVPLIVDHLGLKYIDSVYAISRSVYNGNGNQPPTGLVDRYKEMQEATIKLRDDVRKKSDKLHTIVKNIDLAYKTSPELRGFQGRMVK